MFSIEETNFSSAWGKLFLALMEPGIDELSPTVVTLKSTAMGRPREVAAVRNALDGELAARRLSCHTVANTIFPGSLEKPGETSSDFYSRYFSLEHRIRACHPANRYGTYFERMVDYANGGEPGAGVNQLNHVIEIFRSGNHRRSALQVAIFDPRQDHTNQRQRGFPCLQQVGLGFGDGGLVATALFATQYAFERAYGNWLGLWKLGEYLAEGMGMDFKRLTVIATVAMLGRTTKGKLRSLHREVTRALVEEADHPRQPVELVV